MRKLLLTFMMGGLCFVCQAQRHGQVIYYPNGGEVGVVIEGRIVEIPRGAGVEYRIKEPKTVGTLQRELANKVGLEQREGNDGSPFGKLAPCGTPEPGFTLQCGPGTWSGNPLSGYFIRCENTDKTICANEPTPSQ